MGGVARDVIAYLETDPVVSEALARGVVNLRALSRWLIETQGWKASESAVLSALRRHSGSVVRSGSLDEARALLRKARVTTKTGICVLTVPRTREMQRRLAGLFEVIDYSKGETLRIVQGEPAVMVIIDEENLARVEHALGPGPHGVERGLTELTVFLPEESHWVRGVEAVLSTTLAIRGINLLHAGTAIRANVYLVADVDALRAHEALTALCRPAPGPGTSAARTDSPDPTGSDAARLEPPGDTVPSTEQTPED